MVLRSRWWIDAAPLFLAWVLVVLGCGRPAPAPFTSAETDHALAPARDLWQRCYAGSVFERTGQLVTLEYRLNVDLQGSVRSVPTLVHPEDHTLVECVRHRLDELRFPARGKDHIDLHFELGPSGRPARLASTSPRQLRPGTCEPPCGDGFSCHYERSNVQGVCRVESGRCRFERDCTPSQACQRLAEPLGVCVERNP
jgi:hypothetical protein